MISGNSNEIVYLRGIGPKRYDALVNSGIRTINDLLTYYPTSYITSDSVGSIAEIKDKILSNNLTGEISIIGTVFSQHIHEYYAKKKMFTLKLKDKNDEMFEVLFFNMVEYISKMYSQGMVLLISGKSEYNTYKKNISFSHPQIDIIENEDIALYNVGEILPKYKLTEAMRKTGITIRVMRKIIAAAVEVNNISLEESLPEYVINKNDLCPSKKLILFMHQPNNMEEVRRARYRIKFEEMFWYQVLLNINRTKKIQNEAGIVISKKSKLARELYNTLPFKLTKDQVNVLNDFDRDFRSGKPMNRLLQGDVGSGKTIVALLAMLMVIDAGYQVVMMAPTELLAEQHFSTISHLIANSDLSMATLSTELLLGGIRKKDRNDVLSKIANGTANIVIGTHALFQDDVVYSNLGLVVIDEQHRFGVLQRADLITLAKQSMLDTTISPHLLYMTATPIPRTITMTLYGDLDVSVIRTHPKNRTPVVTRIMYEENRTQVYEFILQELYLGRQTYIVYPLVEKSDKLELKSAVEHYNIMANDIFPNYKCGLLHGQMKWQEKEKVMLAFQRNEYQVLIATTVVEVGIDVPNATVMIVENAERFGLSQLHQLRGRVGRGSDQSYCFLMANSNNKFRINSQQVEDKIAAITRLKAMQDTTDGFALAEIDLRLRGPGDVLGTKQSGLPNFQYIDLVEDIDIVNLATGIAREIVAEDAELVQERNIKIKEYVFRSIGNENFIKIS